MPLAGQLRAQFALDDLLDLGALAREDLAHRVAREHAVDHAAHGRRDHVAADVGGQVAGDRADAGRVERVVRGNLDADRQALDRLERRAAARRRAVLRAVHLLVQVVDAQVLQAREHEHAAGAHDGGVAAQAARSARRRRRWARCAAADASTGPRPRPPRTAQAASGRRRTRGRRAARRPAGPTGGGMSSAPSMRVSGCGSLSVTWSSPRCVSAFFRAPDERSTTRRGRCAHAAGECVPAARNKHSRRRAPGPPDNRRRVPDEAPRPPKGLPRVEHRHPRRDHRRRPADERPAQGLDPVRAPGPAGRPVVHARRGREPRSRASATTWS